jgi:hypothetical protein
LTLDYSDYSDVYIHEDDGDRDCVEDTFEDTGVENCNKQDNVSITLTLRPVHATIVAV